MKKLTTALLVTKTLATAPVVAEGSNIERRPVDVSRINITPQMQIGDRTKVFADFGGSFFSKSEINQNTAHVNVGFEQRRGNATIAMSYGHEFFPALDARRTHADAVVRLTSNSGRSRFEMGYRRIDPKGPFLGIQFDTDRQGPTENAPLAGNPDKVVRMYTADRDIILFNAAHDIINHPNVLLTARAGTFIDENKQAVSFSSDGRLVMRQNVGPSVKLTALGRLGRNVDLKIWGMYNHPIKPLIVTPRSQRTAWGADIGENIHPTRLVGSSVQTGASLVWRINSNPQTNRRLHVPINVRGTKQHFLQDRTCHRPRDLIGK